MSVLTNVINSGFEQYLGGASISSNTGIRGSILTKKQIEYRRCGYIENKQVPDSYKVTISSSLMRVIIFALLQEDVKLNVGGRWEPFAGLVGGDELVEAGTQLLTGKSYVMPWMHRRMWRGSTPIQISMPLKFEAEENPAVEVLAPCVALQCMSLPHSSQVGGGGGGVFDWFDDITNRFSSIASWAAGIFSKNAPSTETIKGWLQGQFLQPPGPSPFVGGVTEENEGDIITLTVGHFLQIERLILKDVRVEFSKRLSSNGIPLGANVDLMFETFEILTKETLLDSYKVFREQPYTDLVSFQNYTNSGL